MSHTPLASQRVCLPMVCKGGQENRKYSWPPFLLRYLSEVLHTIGKPTRFNTLCKNKIMRVTATCASLLDYRKGTVEV